MQFQLRITYEDLKEVLIDLITSQRMVSLRINDGDAIEELLPTRFDYELNTVTYTLPKTTAQREISMYQIQSLTFDAFYSYRGESALTFFIE